MPDELNPPDDPSIAPSGTQLVLRPLIDVDALASRMNKHQDVYQRIRDEALATYAKRHPNPSPYDDRVKTLIRLMAYLWTWGDFYEEGLWVKAAAYDLEAQKMGARDPIFQAYFFVKLTLGFKFSAAVEEDADHLNDVASDFLATEYPPALKLWVCQAVMSDLANFRDNHHPDDSAPSMKSRAHFTELLGQNFRELFKEKWSNEVMFAAGADSLGVAEYDENELDLVISELDCAYRDLDPQSPVAVELDAKFYTTDAWSARGVGYAGTVSDEGGKLFAERLDKADKLLEPLYDKYPNESAICHSMITVELGQGRGRYRMETWFQRAIKIDPNDFSAYEDKEWYLQPRWYGSLDDILAFGDECVKTNNWGARLPTILTKGIARISENDHSIYSRDDIWTRVESVYRLYLYLSRIVWTFEPRSPCTPMMGGVEASLSSNSKFWAMIGTRERFRRKSTPP